jgi:WD40 repeat protein
MTPPDQTISGAAWTPDDGKIVANSSGAGTRVLVAIDARSGGQRPVRTMEGWEVPTSIAPDGTILLDKLISGGLNDLIYIPRGEGTGDSAYLATPANESSGVFSPDGRLVAYSSDASGREEVYLDTFPEHTQARRVSTDGAIGALWRGDGKELYIFAGRAVLACDVSTSPSITVGKPHLLFDLPAIDARGVAVAPDGHQFYLMMPVGENPSALTVVQNWAAQLEKH